MLFIEFYCMKRFCFLLLISLAVLISCGPADKDPDNWRNEPLSPAIPESQGFSSERLDRIDTLFQNYIDNGEIAGATALVARRGGIVYYRSTGYDDLENQVPLEKDAIFRIASQTKGITSVAVMMLDEEGRFTLHDPISLYLPEFRNPKLLDEFNGRDSSFTVTPAKREITIHDLLTHRSGYSYPGNASEAIRAIFESKDVSGGFPDKSSTLEEEIDKIASVPLTHEPGEKFTYGFSTDILGYLVEVLSGQSLEDFCRSRIFNPLGMEDTWFFLPEDKHRRLMNLYEDGLSETGLVKSDRSLVDFPKMESNYCSGGGGLSSTAKDYAIFQQMLLNGGTYNGRRILGRKTVEMMRSNQIGSQSGGSLFMPGDKFGLGFEVMTLPASAGIPISENSYGWGGAFGSLYWMDPEEELIAHLVIQKIGKYNDFRSKFITAVYQALVDH